MNAARIALPFLHGHRTSRQRRNLYPLVGLVLALGSPVGLLALRCHGGHVVACARRELVRECATYVYLACSTSVAFAALGWSIGRHVDRLRAQAALDPLTGLANRGTFESRCREAVQRSHRYGASLSLLLIDIDGLKSINDRDGHAAGDLAIREVARTIAETCRGADTAARIGGDEFAILAPHTRGNEALQLARRVQARLATGATVSIGIADLADLDGASVEGLLRAADAALYQAKRGGRNRAVTYARPSA